MITTDLDIKRHFATINENPAIYVGTYGKYNSGSIFGAWLDLTTFKDEAEFFEVCRALHSDERDPEFMYQDFLNIPAAFRSMSGECIDIAAVMEFYSEYDEEQRNIISEYWEEIDDSAHAADVLERHIYTGDFSEFAEIEADEFITCAGGDNNIISRYFDYAAWERDLRFDYSVTSNYVFTDY